ncbi:hypothetical protein LguiB_030852 [Lonicera macranthoides]
MHQDSRVWSDPCEFQPERFLKEHTGVNFSGLNFEYIPFSSGRRMCPATTFALQVINLALARLLQGYNILTPKGKPVDMREGLGIALPKVEPLQVVFTGTSASSATPVPVLDLVEPMVELDSEKPVVESLQPTYTQGAAVKVVLQVPRVR